MHDCVARFVTYFLYNQSRWGTPPDKPVIIFEKLVQRYFYFFILGCEKDPAESDCVVDRTPRSRNTP